MKQSTEWDKARLLESPLFTPLHSILARLDTQSFPSLQDCNLLLDAIQPTITVHSKAVLRFVSQLHGKLAFAEKYEQRCYLSGELQMRSHNYHDLFNALVWMTFPHTKAILNARHYHALIQEEAAGTTERGAVRDANTLFDESGVIVAYADGGSAALLRDFKWKELFWQQRAQTQAGMGFYLFGHGLYEKALQPYIGMTGHGLLLCVPAEFFMWPLEQQLGHLDTLLADYLSDRNNCATSRDLSPVPVLGVPGWAAENNKASYYDNSAYFRSGRRA